MTGERKQLFSVGAILLVLCLLTSALGFFIRHGDITYRLWVQMRSDSAPSLEEVDVSDWSHYSLSDVVRMPNVRMTEHVMLVRDTYPLPDGFEPTLVEYNGAYMHPDMVNAYVALRDEIDRQTGTRIYVSSDYRTKEEQAEILAESGDGVAAQVGCSEHETGLALDVYVPYFAGENILKTNAGRMLGEICSDYGFIIRYPLSKETVTGITYEPWHLRYVGAPHAEIMTESGVTLEEYLDLLQVGRCYGNGEYLIYRCASDGFFLPNAYQWCEISPDNTGFYLVTVKKS